LIFAILIGLLIVGVFLIIYQKLKALSQEYLYYIGLLIVIVVLFLIPFYDPLQMPGYLAAVIQLKSPFTIFGMLVGLIVINIAIYGIVIFYSSVELITADRYKGKLLAVRYYRKIRHPIFASYHIIGSSFYILMGAPSGLIIFDMLMILLNFEAIRIEKRKLTQRFGESFQDYKKLVPNRIYNNEILGLLIISHSLLILGIIGLVFFADL